MIVAMAGSFDLRAEAEQMEQILGSVAAQVCSGVDPRLAEPIRYALQTRGKRLRPILCCAAYGAVSGKEAPVEVRRLASALELIHTYSLVHDDLPCMDDDDLRRGRPTVHRVFGVPRAVLAGAALIPAAMRVLNEEASALGLSTASRTRIVGELASASGATGMVGGQWRDLEAEAQPTDGAGLEQIHRAKTGALLVAALRVGALAAGADERQFEALSVYGSSVGLAFQITDDLLDVEGETAATGKTGGRDQVLGKSTYPGLFGMERARLLAEEHIRTGLGALKAAGLGTPALAALARHVVERRT